MYDLTDKVALVTGGARRIGRAITLGLARQGAHVVIHYNRSDHDAEAVAAEVRALGVRAWTLQADLADLDSLDIFFSRAVGEAGPIDILVNNASAYPALAFDTMGPRDLEQIARVNTLAPLLLARCVHRQATGAAAVIHLLDAGLAHYDPRHAAYQLSKHTLAASVRMAALEFAPRTRVNAVAPGPILPPEGADPAMVERYRERIPLRAWGSPETVADAVCFLAGNPYVTGQIIHVDGGVHLGGRPPAEEGP